MNNWGKKKTDPSNDINTKSWIDHLENLLNDRNARPADVHGERRSVEPTLDSMITPKGLQDALSNLKGGESSWTG